MVVRFVSEYYYKISIGIILWLRPVMFCCYFSLNSKHLIRRSISILILCEQSALSAILNIIKYLLFHFTTCTWDTQCYSTYPSSKFLKVYQSLKIKDRKANHSELTGSQDKQIVSIRFCLFVGLGLDSISILFSNTEIFLRNKK